MDWKINFPFLGNLVFYGKDKYQIKVEIPFVVSQIFFFVCDTSEVTDTWVFNLLSVRFFVNTYEKIYILEEVNSLNESR